MSNKNMSGDNEEVYVFVDEDGNEIIVDDDLNEVENVEEYMSEDEITMEEEYELKDAFEEDEEDEDDAVYDGRDGILGSVANKMLVVFGAMIALIAIGIGIFFMSRKGGGAADFSKVGKEFTQIGVVGGSKIEEITSLKGAQLDALYQAQGSYSYDEADTEDGITNVSITLTSILKDLKVKFVNSKGKLIANVPFEVEVTGPDGKSAKWTDTDKDGIIYQTELSGGAYSVKVIPLSGYETMYDFSKAEKQSCSVKTQLDYQKVDVKNEIKSSSKVAATEDVSKKETVEEGKNKDTVAFVESAKKPSSSGYTPISKSSVANPMDALTKANEAGLFRFRRLSGPVNTTETGSVSEGEGSGEGSGGEGSGSGQPACQHTNTKAVRIEGTYTHKIVCQDCGETVGSTADCIDTNKDGKCDECGGDVPVETEVKYVQRDGKYYKQTVIKGTDTVKDEVEVPATYEKIDGKKHKVNHEGFSSYEENCVDTDKNGKCDKCDADMIPAATASLTISPDKATIAAGAKTKLKANPTCSSSDYEVKSYTWEISKEGNATIPSPSTGVEVEVTGVKAGTATVTCKVVYTDKATKTKNVEATASATITVGSLELSLDRTAKKVIFVGGDINGASFKLNATLTGASGKTNVKWTYDEKIVKVNGTTEVTAKDGKAVFPATVEGVAPGTTKVTVSYEKDGVKLSKEITFVVLDPRHDYATPLKDNSGNQVYIYDKASKTYKEAHVADYYSNVDLYTPVAVTYIYTGWWQLDGKTYYFDANGNKVTGDQVICGAKYSFGSDGALKSGTGTFGIDVSTWNGTIDWNRVAKSGVSYAIIRCGFRGTTVGGLVADNKFEANVKNAQAAGIKVGIYFFSQATTEAEAVEEASTCLTMIDVYKVKPTYPIFIDIEGAGAGARAANLNKSQRTAVAKAFCKTITNSGYKAGVYSNKSWLTNNIDTASLTGYTIWLAQYAQSPTYTATRYDLWQYSDAGSIAGISGKVDLDLSYMGY